MKRAEEERTTFSTVTWGSARRRRAEFDARHGRHHLIDDGKGDGLGRRMRGELVE